VKIRFGVVGGLLGLLVAGSTVWGGHVAVVITKDCDGGLKYKIVVAKDPVGPQRVSLAHMVPTEDGGPQVDKHFIEIESTRVDLKPDSVLTAFYQTDPAMRALLGPNDTWVAFSADRLVPMDGFVQVGLNFAHGIAWGGNLAETRYVQYALVPHVYAETSQVADSVAAHVRFRLSDGVADNLFRIVSNTFMEQETGRIVSSVRHIPAAPGGAVYSGPLYLPKAGDLVISEIMADPNNGVADATGEWFEVTNVSDVYLNLDGVVVRDLDGEEFRNPRAISDEGAPLVLAPGGIAVIGSSTDPRTNGGAKVDVSTRKQVAHANTADEIILEVDGVGEIDRVDYTGAWNLPSGKSIELTSLGADNNQSSNWAVATQSYGSKGQKGTPGAPYNTAASSPAPGDPGVVPAAGSLVITELNTAPWGEDAMGEWFEIFNPLDTPVILTDLVVEIVQDSGTPQSFRVIDDLILAPRSYHVFTREDRVSMGGLPFGYGYKGAFALHNDNATLRLSFDSTTVDEVSYNAAHFAGFPDYGDGVAGSWPLASEYDGRSTALQGALANLRDTVGYDNNSAGNWALTERWRHNAYGSMLVATPGQPNIEDGTLSLFGTPSTINALAFDTFRVTITPPSGYAVADIDTQSIRLFWRQRPVFVKVNATTLEADFRFSDAPWPIERNVSSTAVLSACYLGETAIRFGGSWTVTVQDTTRPTPAALSTPGSGDLKIVEIMVNAAGEEGDNEYIELLNMTSDKTFDLRVLGVQDGGGATSDGTPEGRTRIYNRGDGSAIRLGPGQRAAIGRNHTGRFLGFPSRGSMLNQDLNFANTGDQVVIFRLSDNVAIAEVDYEVASAGFLDQNATAAEGRALTFIDTALDPSQGANWINASIPFRLLVDTSFGTPGTANRVASNAGSIILTEVYADPPPGGEPNAEFFEVWNPDTAGPIDLSGLVLTDDSGNTVAISDRPGLIVSGGAQRTYIPAGGVLVFGNSRGASDGVDATFADTYGASITGYDYANSWTLLNSSDAVRLVRNRYNDSTVVTGMSYTSTSPGKSWAIQSLAGPDTWVLRIPNPTEVP
jgi:hypothetical protein